MLESINSPRGLAMYEINSLLIVCMLVVLIIYIVMLMNRIDKYLVKVGHT